MRLLTRDELFALYYGNGTTADGAERVPGVVGASILRFKRGLENRCAYLYSLPDHLQADVRRVLQEVGEEWEIKKEEDVDDHGSEARRAGRQVGPY